MFGLSTQSFDNAPGSGVSELSSKKDPDDSKDLFSGVMVPNQNKNESFGRIAYVKSDSVVCLNGPELEFDAQVGTLFYGDRVTVTRIKDKFVEVEAGTVHGWVESTFLTDDLKEIIPSLRSAYIYGVTNEETIKLRRYIHDEALGQELGLSLQSIEYILFILKKTGIKVSWPPVRPREPGVWKTILRGLKGVSMGVEPKTGSVLEYAGNGTPGFIGYVEAVHPDQSITLQTVGRVEEGEYRVEEFSHEEWKEWRPVFICFT